MAGVRDQCFGSVFGEAVLSHKTRKDDEGEEYIFFFFP